MILILHERKRSLAPSSSDPERTHRASMAASHSIFKSTRERFLAFDVPDMENRAIISQHFSMKMERDNCARVNENVESDERSFTPRAIVVDGMNFSSAKLNGSRSLDVFSFSRKRKETRRLNKDVSPLFFVAVHMPLLNSSDSRMKLVTQARYPSRSSVLMRFGSVNALVVRPGVKRREKSFSKTKTPLYFRKIAFLIITAASQSFVEDPFPSSSPSFSSSNIGPEKLACCKTFKHIAMPCASISSLTRRFITISRVLERRLSNFALAQWARTF